VKNKIILGTAQLGFKYGINNEQQVKKDESFRILQYAHDNGIEYLDTAPVYGNSHSIIGEFQKSYKKRPFKIITKLPANTDYKNIINKVIEYKNQLKVETIDILLFHSISTYLKIKDCKDILSELINNKIVDKLGISIYEDSEVNFFIDDPLIRVVQLPFNLLDNYSLRGKTLQRLKNNNKTIHTRSTFLQGLFFNEKILKNKELKININILNDIALKNKISVQCLALSYCLSQNEIDNVVIGVDSLDHLQNNIENSKTVINYESFKKINEIEIYDKDLINPSLWKKNQKLF